ncbi:hypothetical protein Acsp03_05200 [Actinomadura sp. NBRC 104412]|uniref:TetR/AcrR family transcriptional regulator n=1 Tax=Actinomadura sp. NBRC 104412 TaxID=3032203 RepID=UPI0024A2EEED|nr:TetR/AcrR family transcriptional regulator [Actinomadura sp. NBRC 104412]GLZ03053.1 hypothetical protein Acsp03_05200 [Actinomadura sp. NBRC 104412]
MASRAAGRRTTAPPGEPRQDRSRRSHAALLRAALENFSAHGWRGASVDRIARDAGVSVGTVYTRFGSKRDLLQAVVGQRVEEIAELLVSPSDLLSDPVGALVRSMRTAVERRRAAAGLLGAWSEACVDHPELRLQEEAIRAALLERLRGVLEALAPLPGVRPELDPSSLAVAIGGLLEGLHEPPWSLLDDETAARTCAGLVSHAVFLDGALPGPGTAGDTAGRNM